MSPGSDGEVEPCKARASKGSKGRKEVRAINWPASWTPWVWVAIGLLSLLGGLWEMLEVELPLVPILFVVAGLALLFSAVKGKHPTRR